MKKCLFISLCMLCILMLLGISVVAAPQKQGNCGDSITWSLDNGTLNINGTGEMYDYSFNNRPDWMSFFTDVNKVIISEGVTSIGNFAFNNCEMVTEISIPSTVISIGESALDGCLRLKELTLPENLTYIGDSAFGSCFTLKELTIPAGVKEIRPATFIACQNLEELYISNGTESIAANAFYDCFKLKITLPQSISYIAPSAFDPAPKLVRCVYGSYAESFARSKNWNIEYSADFTASGMLGDNLTWKYNNGTLTVSGSGDMNYTGIAPYYNLKDLITEIIIGDEVTSVCNFAFNMYEKLESVHIGKGVTHIGTQAFYECYRMKNITFTSDALESLGDGALSFCVALTDITLPYGLKHIGNDTFSYSYKLSTLEIPDTVTHIGENAFAACEKLTLICSNGSVAHDYAMKHGVLLEGEYTDVSRNAWYYESIRDVSLKGYMSGMGDKKFSPQTNLTRAQFVQLLFAMEGLDKTAYDGETGFSDVPEGKWFSPAVKWAKDTGITSGTGEGIFNVNGMVTREQLAQFMMKYAEYKNHDVSGKVDISPYVDASSVSKWAYPAVEWAVHERIFTSMSDTSLILAPQSYSTRAIAARVVSVFDTVIN